MKAKRGKRQETKGKRRKAKGKRGEARGKRGEAKGKRGEGAFSRLASHFSPFADGMPQDRYKTLFYALIALYGVLILSTFRQYGITVDEPPQVAYGQAIFDWYFGEGNITDLFEKDKALELYGVLFNLVAYSTSQLLPFDIYDAHHLANAVVGLLGVVIVYKIGTALGTSSTGLLAAVLLLLMPRYYGHAFNNPKDIPFAICYAWSLYHLIRGLGEIPHLSWKRIIFTGLGIGTALGTRVGGLILFAYLGLFWTLAYVFLVTTRNKIAHLKMYAIQLGCVIAIAWVVMLAVWPRAQQEPFTYPFYALRYFSHFTHHNTTFFDGQIVLSVDVPRNYALQWLAMVLPELHMICLVAGLYYLVCHFKKRTLSHRHLQWALIAFAVVFPLAYVVAIRAPLYAGFRHFLFVLPPLAVLCAGGLERTFRHLLQRVRIVWIIPVLLAGLTLYDMIRLHPNEYVYFNRIYAGGLFKAAQKYDTDYWENTYKQGIAWLDKHYAMLAKGRSKLRVGAESKNAQYMLDKARYVFNPVPEHIDVYLSTTRENHHKLVPGEIFHIVKRDRVPLFYVIRADSSYDTDPFFIHPVSRYSILGWKYIREKNYPGACEAYKNALHHAPKEPFLHTKIGFVYLQLKEYEKAREHLERSLVLNPRYAEAYRHLGQVYIALNQYDKALATYHKLSTHTPEFADIYFNIGVLSLKQLQFESAIEAFEKVLQYRPTDHEAHWYLAVAYEHSNLILKAIGAYRNVLKYKGADPKISAKIQALQNTRQKRE